MALVVSFHCWRKWRWWHGGRNLTGVRIEQASEKGSVWDMDRGLKSYFCTSGKTVLIKRNLYQRIKVQRRKGSSNYMERIPWHLFSFRLSDSTSIWTFNYLVILSLYPHFRRKRDQFSILFMHQIVFYRFRQNLPISPAEEFAGIWGTFFYGRRRPFSSSIAGSIQPWYLAIARFFSLQRWEGQIHLVISRLQKKENICQFQD